MFLPDTNTDTVALFPEPPNLKHYKSGHNYSLQKPGVETTFSLLSLYTQHCLHTHTRRRGSLTFPQHFCFFVIKHSRPGRCDFLLQWRIIRSIAGFPDTIHLAASLADPLHTRRIKSVRKCPNTHTHTSHPFHSTGAYS